MRGKREMTNKKGISDVITTIIIVGLSLVAIAVVWAVINGVVNRGAGGASLSAKCLGITVEPNSVNCLSASPFACTVALSRTGTGTDALGGVKLVFKNATATSNVFDVPGDIVQLQVKTVVLNSTLNNTNNVGTTIYFLDSSGNQQLCSTTDSFDY